jgi:hypothetical protein
VTNIIACIPLAIPPEMIGKLGESAPADVSEVSFPNIPMTKFIQVQGDHSVILLGGQVGQM